MSLIKFTTEKDWLEARKQDITSTEIAALMGMSQHKTRLRLWMEKAGKVESDFEETAPTRWGRRLQAAIGAGISEDEGWECFDLTGYYLRDEEARIGASMDFRVICPERGEGLLETKSTGFFDEGMGWFKDRAPIDYEFQLITQVNLAVADGQPIKWGAVGALDGRKNSRVWRRLPDADLHNMIRAEADKFWWSIKHDEPPAPDFTADADLIRKLQGNVNVGQNVSLTGNNRAESLMSRWDSLQGEVKILSEPIDAIIKEQKEIVGEIHYLMGQAETAIIGEYRVNAREQRVDERLQHGYSFRRFDAKKSNRKRA